jgi:hypothetical protein
MWCDKCQADVAAMASPDNERLYCTACGSELPRLASAPVAAATPTAGGAKKTLPDPRELLARWAREDALGSLDLVPPAAHDSRSESRAHLRFDPSHARVSPQDSVVHRLARPESHPAPIAAATGPEMPAHDVVIHPPHAVHPPHFLPNPVPQLASPADKSSKWVTLVGQICAYVGVGGLTVGTVLVLMGYFGGPAHYATTGWLVTTAGQMLLFLGVITLVSGGMEQTTQEVARRIDTLGERLGRIEEVARSGHPGEPRHHEDAGAR